MRHLAGDTRRTACEDRARRSRAVVRGKGVATAMIKFAMERHRDVRGNRFFLTAQTDKVARYQRIGFKEFGEEFLDGGIPHLAMKNYWDG